MRLFKIEEGALGGEALEDVDEDAVRLGDVEADVGDGVGDEGVHHGKYGVVDDTEIDDGG